MQEKEPILKVEDLHFTYNGEKTALARTEQESLHSF